MIVMNIIVMIMIINHNKNSKNIVRMMLVIIIIIIIIIIKCIIIINRYKDPVSDQPGFHGNVFFYVAQILRDVPFLSFSGSFCDSFGHLNILHYCNGCNLLHSG